LSKRERENDARIKRSEKGKGEVGVLPRPGPKTEEQVLRFASASLKHHTESRAAPSSPTGTKREEHFIWGRKTRPQGKAVPVDFKKKKQGQKKIKIDEYKESKKQILVFTDMKNWTGGVPSLPLLAKRKPTLPASA